MKIDWSNRFGDSVPVSVTTRYAFARYLLADGLPFAGGAIPLPSLFFIRSALFGGKCLGLKIYSILAGVEYQ